MKTLYKRNFTSLLLAVIILGFMGSNALAEPQLQYASGGNVRAIVGLGDPMPDCGQRIADVVVDDVVYQGVSTIVAGFRAKKLAPTKSKENGNQLEFYGLFRINNDALYKAIPNSERLDVQSIIKNGANLIVIYQVCGNGGYLYVRDIFKKSSINNP